MKSISLILPTIALIAGTLPVVKASSDDANLQLMQKALLELQIRVEALEAVKPTFTSLMPNFSERFHVMHRAGEAGDWAVAGHELAEMKRLTALSSYIDAKNGALMQGMMGPRLETKAVNIECLGTNIRSQRVHVPFSLTDTWQLYQYGREWV